MTSSPAMRSFYAKNLKNIGSPVTATLPRLEGVPFGTLFAPLAVHCDWTQANGWADPVMKDFGPISMPMQSGGVNYALHCFEGAKAYYSATDDTVRLFRPDRNAARMNRSMEAIAFPSFDEVEWVEVLKRMVHANRAFVPKKEGYSLYLRPGACATNENLSVGPSNKITLWYMGSPVGPYYPNGIKPVKLICDPINKRAWPGGSGSTKIGANYAATIGHQVRHAKEGYDQVLWLGADGELNEAGAMNIMVLWKNEKGERELITPVLDGTILPGVTRDSVLQLATGFNEFKVTSDRTVNISEVEVALKENRVEEMFGCGTAAIISAVNCIKIGDTAYTVPFTDSKTSVTSRILRDLSDIQYGRKAHDWSVVVD